MKPTPSAYMPALDGLRALAVAAVFAYHLSLPVFRGGFLGVDLFFVISGFLITTLLVTEAERTHRVRIKAFWMRRVRRLLPALVLMVAVVSAAALLIGRDLDAGLRLQVLGAAVYGSNWLQIASGASYVEHYEPSLLTHLWSLGVEEQFYLIWPFVVVVVLSFVGRRRFQVLAVCLLAAASAAWMALVFVPGADPTRVYVGTDTHGFGLLLGAALGFGLNVRRRAAVTVRPPRVRVRPGLLSAMGLVGYMVVLAGMLLLTDQSTATFRGGIVLVDVAAVGLVAAAARGAGPVGVVFAFPMLTWIGRRSYGIYLWHWPVIVIAERLLPRGTGTLELAVIAVVVTMVATEISWRLVEVPIRTVGFRRSIGRLTYLTPGRRRTRPLRRSLGWLGLGTFAGVFTLAACGVVIAPATSGLADQLAAGEQALSAHPDRPIHQFTSYAHPAAEPEQPDTAAPRAPSTTPSAAAVPPTRPPMVSRPSAAVGPPAAGASTAPKPASGPAVRPTAKRSTAAPGGPSTVAAKPTSRVAATPPRATPKPTPRPVPKPAPRPAPRPAPKPAPPPDPALGPVSAIGDSLMLGAAPDIFAAFPTINIDASVSRQWWDLPGVIDTNLKKPGLAPVVILGLGTNGTWPSGDILAALRPLGDRTVVLVNTYEKRSWEGDVNAQLAAVAAQRPHTCIADWHARAGANPGWIGFDGVHPGPEGRKGYTDLVKQAVSGCS